MKRIAAAFSLTLIFGINAWAQPPEPEIQKPVKFGITDKTTVIGVEFMPPADTGWSMTRPGSSVSLKKKGESDDEEWEIEAYLINLQTPVNSISAYAGQIRKNLQKGIEQSAQYKLASLEITEYPDKGQCVKIHHLLEDHRHGKWSEQYTLSCGLVKNNRIGVEVRYYHRFRDPNKDDLLSEKANRIFESVKISDE